MNLPDHFSMGSQSFGKDPLLMSDPGWWRVQSPDLLNDVLVCINSSRSKKTTTERRTDLVAALNTMWKAAIRHQKIRVPRSEIHLLDDSQKVQSLAELSANEIEELLDSLFDRPSQRLAVYGTLKPGESNEGQLAGIEGEWLDGVVHGIIEQPGEYLEFTWIVDAGPVQVKVFSAPTLREHFGRLDEFEGPDYRRSLVPVMIDGVIQICMIYEGGGKDYA